MKKTLIILLLIFIPSFANADDKGDIRKIEHLEDQKTRLSAEYARKRQELSELTMKIHEVDTQLEELKTKLRQSRTRTVGNLQIR